MMQNRLLEAALVLVNELQKEKKWSKRRALEQVALWADMVSGELRIKFSPEGELYYSDLPFDQKSARRTTRGETK